MKPNFIDKNLSALKKNPNTSIEFSPRPFSEEVEYFAAQNGQISLRCNGMLMHSAYDPQKEGEKFSEKVQSGAKVCLYGMGFGYHLRPILEKIGAEGSLLVIELNPYILSAALTLMDLSDVFEDSRFQLVFSEDEPSAAESIARSMQHLTENSNGTPDVLFHSPSFKCIPKYFPKLSNALEILLMERRFPAALGGIERQNYLTNKNVVHQTPGINALYKVHEGQSALLISAGPSLDNILPYLKPMQTQSLIACVDTALPILYQAGIAPDYIFTLDPQTENCKYLADLPHQKGALVFTPTAHPHTISNARSKKYVAIQNGHSLFKNDPLIDEKGVTQSGGSVSCFALDCLIQFGCRPILLCGQDCAFSGNRIYARNARQSLDAMDRLTSANVYGKAHELKAAKSKCIPVSDTQGRIALTNQNMYGYLRSIEDIVATHPEVEIFNFGSHGAKIDNTVNTLSIAEAATHAPKI